MEKNMSSSEQIKLKKTQNAEIKNLLQKAELLRAQMKISSEELKRIQDQILEDKQNERSLTILESKIDKLKIQLEDAKSMIKSITPSQLEEISKYKNPPEKIKIALEAIFLLLTSKILNWNDIKKEMSSSSSGFIERVLKLNLSKLNKKVLIKLKTDYINKDKWDIEKLKRASKAMGPLGEFLESMVDIADIDMDQQQKNTEELQKLKKKRKVLLEKEKKCEKNYSDLELQLKDIENKINKQEKEYEKKVEKEDEKEKNTKKINLRGLKKNEKITNFEFIDEEQQVPKKEKNLIKKKPNILQNRDFTIQCNIGQNIEKKLKIKLITIRKRLLKNQSDLKRFRKNYFIVKKKNKTLTLKITKFRNYFRRIIKKYRYQKQKLIYFTKTISKLKRIYIRRKTGNKKNNGLTEDEDEEQLLNNLGSEEEFENLLKELEQVEQEEDLFLKEDEEDEKNEDIENDEENEDIENDEEYEDIENDQENEDIENDEENEDIENDEENEDIGNDEENEDIENDEENEDIGNDEENEDIENDEENKKYKNDLTRNLFIKMENIVGQGYLEEEDSDFNIINDPDSIQKKIIEYKKQKEEVYQILLQLKQDFQNAQKNYKHLSQINEKILREKRIIEKNLENERKEKSKLILEFESKLEQSEKRYLEMRQLYEKEIDKKDNASGLTLIPSNRKYLRKVEKSISNLNSNNLKDVDFNEEEQIKDQNNYEKEENVLSENELKIIHLNTKIDELSKILKLKEKDCELHKNEFQNQLKLKKENFKQILKRVENKIFVQNEENIKLLDNLKEKQKNLKHQLFSLTKNLKRENLSREKENKINELENNEFLIKENDYKKKLNDLKLLYVTRENEIKKDFDNLKLEYENLSKKRNCGNCKNELIIKNIENNTINKQNLNFPNDYFSFQDDEENNEQILENFSDSEKNQNLEYSGSIKDKLNMKNRAKNFSNNKSNFNNEFKTENKNEDFIFEYNKNQKDTTDNYEIENFEEEFKIKNDFDFSDFINEDSVLKKPSSNIKIQKEYPHFEFDNNEENKVNNIFNENEEVEKNNTFQNKEQIKVNNIFNENEEVLENNTFQNKEQIKVNNIFNENDEVLENDIFDENIEVKENNPFQKKEQIKVNNIFDENEQLKENNIFNENEQIKENGIGIFDQTEIKNKNEKKNIFENDKNENNEMLLRLLNDLKIKNNQLELEKKNLNDQMFLIKKEFVAKIQNFEKDKEKIISDFNFEKKDNFNKISQLEKENQKLKTEKNNLIEKWNKNIENQEKYQKDYNIEKEELDTLKNISISPNSAILFDSKTLQNTSPDFSDGNIIENQKIQPENLELFEMNYNGLEISKNSLNDKNFDNQKIQPENLELFDINYNGLEISKNSLNDKNFDNQKIQPENLEMFDVKYNNKNNITKNSPNDKNLIDGYENNKNNENFVEKKINNQNQNLENVEYYENDDNYLNLDLLQLEKIKSKNLDKNTPIQLESAQNIKKYYQNNNFPNTTKDLRIKENDFNDLTYKEIIQILNDLKIENENLKNKYKKLEIDYFDKIQYLNENKETMKPINFKNFLNSDTPNILNENTETMKPINFKNFLNSDTLNILNENKETMTLINFKNFSNSENELKNTPIISNEDFPKLKKIIDKINMEKKQLQINLKKQQVENDDLTSTQQIIIQEQKKKINILEKEKNELFGSSQKKN